MIRIENLRKELGGRQVLDGVTFRIERGEVLALVGPSGTGKSVLLKHIVGLMAPDAGDVYVDGQPVGDARYHELVDVRRRVGYVFQNAALLDSLTVAENLRLALDDESCASDQAYCARCIRDTLATVNLDETVLEKRPGELSGGMQKRIAVARAIVHGPEIVLYDEPTTGLDPENVAAVNEVILRTRDRLGATSVVVTHDIPSVGLIADRVALLYQGRVRFVGSVEELFSSRDPRVLAFTSARPGYATEAA
jgi:phospholipid/cholesterol/gamma-HCH transport system ATP-binding protein